MKSSFNIEDHKQTFPALFDIDSYSQLSPALVELKKHDIGTHNSSELENPWIAIPLAACRDKFLETAKLYDCALDDIIDTCASICRILDEAGMIFYGKTESDVIDQAYKFSVSHFSKKEASA